MLCDDPKALQRYENTYYDPDYDAWEKEFDQEQATAQTTQPNVELPDPDTVTWSGQNHQSSTPSTLDTEEYETYDTSDMDRDDWEKED